MNDYPYFNTRIGTQTIGAKYSFTDRSPLIETANGIYEMGSDVLKFSLSSIREEGYTYYPLIDLAQKEENKYVFNMPFKYYFMWVQPKFGLIDGAIDLIVDEAIEAKIYQEVYELTEHLLTTYNNSGKVFMMGNWEGDWILLQGYDRDKDPDADFIKGLIKNFSIRQKAVEDARQNTKHNNVWVGHYIEVNRVLDAKDRNLSRITNKVLPHIRVDMVSYSAYDSLWPNRLSEALSYIEDNSHFTDYLNLHFHKKVFVGEYDAYRDYHQNGYFSPQMQVENTLTVITSAIAWGAPFVLFWEFYNNDIENLKHGGGFWLINDRNEKEMVYYLHQSLLFKIHAFKTFYRIWFLRNPYDEEFSAIIGKLNMYTVTDLLKHIINSKAYQRYDNNIQFINKTVNLLFDKKNQSNVENFIEPWLKDEKLIVSRFQFILELMDSPYYENHVDIEGFKRKLKLNNFKFKDNTKHSEIFLYYLNHSIFMEELFNRRNSDDDIKLLYF